jgi:hypothetical protein
MSVAADAPDEPLDTGNGVVSASFGRAGAWLSLGRAHPRRGFVELTGLPAFSPEWRGDPAAVRRYRGWMADDRFAFLDVAVDGASEALAHRTLVDGAFPAWELVGAGHRHEIVAWAPPEQPQLVQRHRISGAERVVVRFRGRLDAHPLPEITECDPPPPSDARTTLRAHGDRLIVAARALPADAQVGVRVRGGTAGAWRIGEDEARLDVAPRVPGADVELEVDCALGEPAPGEGDGLDAARRHHEATAEPAVRPAGGPLQVPAALCDALCRGVERAREYVLACTAVPVAEGEVCLLTDHRMLPLSWTRDAYFQAALLLATGARGGVGERVVAGHLRWLWGRCERPDGLWMRSHHPSGAAKDRAYQVDQQLYPVLELADFRSATGTLPRPPASGESAAALWGRAVRELWAAVPVSDCDLVATEENPADDPSSLPYPLSSQILYWHAATRLAALAGELGLDVDFAGTARAVRAAVAEHFRVEGPFGPQWAYEADGRGGHRLYHDANDLPTALAPLLGFCSEDDPLWGATMRFAFSSHNRGHQQGRFGGLGSLHTPGTWTLGDVQEWVWASLVGDRARARRALERLLFVGGRAGMLPEAYDPRTGGSPVRRWFAWPGAALGMLLALYGGTEPDNAGLGCRAEHVTEPTVG